jgi:predicted nucleotidyltransferase
MAFEFTLDHIKALKDLSTVIDPAQWVLIGGAALACQMDMPRVTQDLDLAVAINPGDLSDLMRRLPRKEGSAISEQRWITPQGIKVDLLPVSLEPSGENTMSWPVSKNALNLTGAHLAFKYFINREIAEDFVIRIAELKVIFLLKMVAYLDSPMIRDKDLQDIAWLLAKWLPETDDRRWSSEIIEMGMDFDLVPPYVMGREVSEIVEHDERDVILKFIAKVRDPDDKDSTQQRFTRMGKGIWQDDPEKMLKYIDAFLEGFGGG